MDFLDDLSWEDVAVYSNPVGWGYIGAKKVYEKANEKGNKAAQQGLSQAGTELTKLKQSQYAQRMADLEKAMAYFGDVDELMLDMYGGRKKKQQKEIMANPTARRGIGHFGGGPPPPAPPGAPAASYFTPAQPMPGVRSPMGPEAPASGPYDPLKGRRGGR